MKNKITNKGWQALLENKHLAKSVYHYMLDTHSIDIPEIKDKDSYFAIEHIAEFYVAWDDPLYGN